jgi:dipeptidyl-peptidase III
LVCTAGYGLRFLTALPKITYLARDTPVRRSEPRVHRDLPITAQPNKLLEQELNEEQDTAFERQHQGSEASSSQPPSPRPPPFSSLYFPPLTDLQRHIKASVTETACSSILATAPAPSFEETLAEDEAEAAKVVSQSEHQGESSGKGLDDGEPPPPYTEESIPLESFTYVMAAAGGAASIITQVQQTAGPPINALGGKVQDGPGCTLATR